MTCFIACGRDQPSVQQHFDARRLAKEQDQGRGIEAVRIGTRIELRAESDAGNTPATGEIDAGRPKQTGRVAMAPRVYLGNQVIEGEAQTRSHGRVAADSCVAQSDDCPILEIVSRGRLIGARNRSSQRAGQRERRRRHRKVGIALRLDLEQVGIHEEVDAEPVRIENDVDEGRVEPSTMVRIGVEAGLPRMVGKLCSKAG